MTINSRLACDHYFLKIIFIAMNTSAKAKPKQIYIFSGEDEYHLVQDAKNLVNKLILPEEQTLGLEIIEGKARIIEEAVACIAKCIEAVRAPGFMGARKAIWLRGANFLDRSIIARSNDVTGILDSLTKLFKTGLPSASHGLPAGNIFVVTANAVDKASVFFKACQAKGEIYQQAALKPWEKDKAAAAFTRSVLQNNKLKVTPDVVAAIVELAGTDSRQLLQEVNKLALFIYPRQQPSADDVFAIVSASRESNSFSLADAAGTRNLPKAIAILRQLLFQKESEIGLVMGLESRFRYLLILREMTSEKVSSDERRALEPLLATEKGRPPQGYYLDKLVEQAKLFSRQELESAREAILETRLKLVSSTGLEEILLEKLLVKLCRHKKQPISR